VEDGREKINVSPSLYGFFEALSIVICCTHGYGIVVPYLRTIRTKVEKVILSFDFPREKREYGRPYEDFFHKIITGKDAFVCYEPNESVDFRSVLCQPHFCPYMLLWDKMEGFLNTIIFLNSECAL
jgi:hypothetical protein